MTNINLLIAEIKTLPPNRVGEVLDFVQFIKTKETKNTVKIDTSWPKVEEDYSSKECPLCAIYINPGTGELSFNGETAAAFLEGDAMLKGDNPAVWFTSLDEMLSDLEN